jgi:type VI secretion system protein ImpM
MDDTTNNYGLYGKLPAHGDFISRNLPSAFISHLDEWLQGFIASSKEQLTDDWLNIYLTGPIWRFVFSPGCVDGNAWAGVLIPSVDSVGRYFPFVIVVKLQNDNNLVDVLSSQAGWYGGLEDIALDALQNEYDADTVMEKLSEHPFVAPPYCYRKEDTQGYQDPSLVSDNLALTMDFEEQLPSSANAVLLDWLMSKQYPSYSLWHSKGSDRVQPSFLLSPGLPNLSGVAGMLQGDWKNWSWNMPFQLASEFDEPEEMIF